MRPKTSSLTEMPVLAEVHTDAESDGLITLVEAEDDAGNCEAAMVPAGKATTSTRLEDRSQPLRLSVASGVSSRVDDPAVNSDTTDSVETNDQNETASFIVLKKIFNLSCPKVGLLIIKVNINNVLVTAIIDSGAECSLISSALAESLSLPVEPHECAYRVIGQNSFNTLGTTIYQWN